MLCTVDAQQALADLTEISSQIEAAVVFDEKDGLQASTLADGNRATELARSAAELLARAEPIKTGDAALMQLEAATLEGSVFVVRDGARRIAATTRPAPTVGLVFYDLKSALRQIAEKPAAKRKPAAKKSTSARKTPAAKKTTTQKPAATKKPSTSRKKPDAS